jgi:hypothetical protein
MLDEEEIRTVVRDMWQLHQDELVALDRVYEYVNGMRGWPAIPDGAEQEIQDLARLSVKNVLSLVRDSFVQNLSVVGYRDALAKENSTAWTSWQKNRMDARQVEVYRPAITYGASYVVVTKDDEVGALWRSRSPRQLLAVYEDPQTDMWPQYAFETWIDQSDAKPFRRGVLYDDAVMYPLEFGEVPVLPRDRNATDVARAAGIRDFGEPVAHGASQCPVVRFVNARDAEDVIVGEIAPLLTLQRAINTVNFDRLLVSRFGAFPQKVISGWSGTESEVLKASAKRVWTFEDPDVKTQSFPPASMEQYNSVLGEMLEHVAMVAQISPAQVTGKLINVSAEALAAAEANQQRKLQSKRDSFGESWEQTFRLAAQIDGDTATSDDESAEVVWRDTEARAFGAIVDGIAKLAAAGVPIAELLELIPNLTQQKIQAIKDSVRRGQATQLITALTRPAPPPPGQMPPNGQQPQEPPRVAEGVNAVPG